MLWQKGLTDGTWANKVNHLRSYITFTSYFGVADFPVLHGVLLRFIALLGRGPYAYSSATNMLGSLRWFANFLDPPSVKIFDTVLVSSTVKGLKAQLSRPVCQKLPLSVDHLAKFCDSLDLSNPKHLSGWCAMLLAFFGCFRLSNLVPSSKPKFDPLKHLKRDDIKFDKDIVLIFYKWSKTNQNSSRISWIPICAVADGRFNVKFYLQKLLNDVTVSSNAPLFTFSKGNFHTLKSLINGEAQINGEAGIFFRN